MLCPLTRAHRAVLYWLCCSACCSGRWAIGRRVSPRAGLRHLMWLPACVRPHRARWSGGRLSGPPMLWCAHSSTEDTARRKMILRSTTTAVQLQRHLRHPNREPRNCRRGAMFLATRMVGVGGAAPNALPRRASATCGGGMCGHSYRRARPGQLPLRPDGPPAPSPHAFGWR